MVKGLAFYFTLFDIRQYANKKVEYLKFFIYDHQIILLFFNGY